MASVSRWVLVDESNHEEDYEYDTYPEALDAAQRQGKRAIIERTYEYADSELVWTPDGGDVWPPSRRDDPDPETSEALGGTDEATP